MDREKTYQELKDLAEKLQISVLEENLRKTGVKAKSGFCVLKGRKLFIMDKHKPLRDKVDILAGFLAAMPLENIYLLPALRQLLKRHAPVKRAEAVPHGAEEGK